MSNFQGDYLRILTPQTVNGIVPEMKNGQQVYKESHAELGARKEFEKENLKLPDHLKHILEDVVTGFGVTTKKQRTQRK